MEIDEEQEMLTKKTYGIATQFNEEREKVEKGSESIQVLQKDLK